MADWSSLPPDLIRRVGDLFLVDNDIDYYMNMRAVCHNWSSAAADPCAKDKASKDDDTRLFVNVDTGRFLRRRLPLLRVHFLTGSSDGLLVLGDRPYPYRACVFNPFTGSMVKFAAAIRPYLPVLVVVTASHPMLLFAMGASFGLDLWCADSASQRFWTQASRHDPLHRTSMLSYRGDVYMVDECASVIKIAGVVRHSTTGELVAEIVDVVVSLEGAGTDVKKFRGCNYLAESDGDLLLVRLLPSALGVMEVYRVDVERKVVEPVKSIGGHALFLGARCVSVDAAKFPSVDGDCVYCTTCQQICCCGIYRYSLGDGTKERVFPAEQVRHDESFRVRPLSLVQVLNTCCNRGRST
ncbi:hypothetical protein ACQ4PT_039633 [Festuca glaucescens]